MKLDTFTVFDAEWTSIQHDDGHAFAVGAVHMNMQGDILAHFQGRCPIESRPSIFVAEHVMPAVRNMEKTHASQHMLRNDFWMWLREYGIPVFADMGSFADGPFLHLCIRDDLGARALRGIPFPLHEVATLLIAAGTDMNISRIAYAKKTGLLQAKFIRGMGEHHPLFDAYVSGLCVIQAIREISGHKDKKQ